MEVATNPHSRDMFRKLTDSYDSCSGLLTPKPLRADLRDFGGLKLSQKSCRILTGLLSPALNAEPEDLNP